MSERKGLQPVSASDVRPIEEILEGDPDYIERGIAKLRHSVYDEEVRKDLSVDRPEGVIPWLQRQGTVGLRTLIAAEVTVVGIAIDLQERAAGLVGIHSPEI